ncbi:hypothetical protein ACFL2Q_10880 [Thermodesulfobacteriota bacterium]
MPFTLVSSGGEGNSGAKLNIARWYPYAILSLLWILIVLVVNPVGGFMVNDDWSFFKAFERFNEQGEISSTGWGPSNAPGGPSLIAQLLWAWPFAQIGGTSPTVLRLSVLTLGIIGSFGFLYLLSLCGIPRGLQLMGTLTLVLNPYFLSQSFTFMTDVPFTSFLILSLLFIFLGFDMSSPVVVAIGLFIGLLATLTRQIGLAIPLGFMATVLVHPVGKQLGRLRMCLLASAIGILPWIGYEVLLAHVGGTPVTEHQVIHRMFKAPLSKGFVLYVLSLALRTGYALCYSCLLVSPVIALVCCKPPFSRLFKRIMLVFLLAFLVLEIGLLSGALELPVIFLGNVFFNYGIGPVLLKDIYILGKVRTWTIQSPMFCLWSYWALLAATCLFAHSLLTVKRLASTWSAGGPDNKTCLTFLAGFTGLIYLAAILLTGFFDRYLLPIMAVLIIGLCALYDRRDRPTPWMPMLILGSIMLFVIGCFSILGTRDFFEMKRSLHKAHNYLVYELEEDPCKVDGGFEFNGYHCYRNGFKPKRNRSWWWVSQEDYVVTLGSLDGYGIVKVFPFHRWLGPPGRVCVLKPIDPK